MVHKSRLNELLEEENKKIREVVSELYKSSIILLEKGIQNGEGKVQIVDPNPDSILDPKYRNVHSQYRYTLELGDYRFEFKYGLEQVGKEAYPYLQLYLSASKLAFLPGWQVNDQRYKVLDVQKLGPSGNLKFTIYLPGDSIKMQGWEDALINKTKRIKEMDAIHKYKAKKYFG
ncbi:MAG: hypothetical protein M1580_00145 [Candidatus Parvarchaeota archaeon]|nr:hypothetical protein [Candidatus Parvarchaeota archaeon]